MNSTPNPGRKSKHVTKLCATNADAKLLNSQRRNFKRKRPASLTQSRYDFVLAKLATKETVQYFGGHIKEMRPHIYNSLKKGPHAGDFAFPTLKTR